MNIEFDSESVYDDSDKYIKTKINLYENRVNTKFQGKNLPKEYASCKCLSFIMLVSLIRANKNTTLKHFCKIVNMQ